MNLRALGRQWLRPKPKYASETGQLFESGHVDPRGQRSWELQWEQSDVNRAAARNARPLSRDVLWSRHHEPFVQRQGVLFDPGRYGRPEEDDWTLRTRQQLFRQGWGS